jgi:hypothetical protein
MKRSKCAPPQHKQLWQIRAVEYGLLGLHYNTRANEMLMDLSKEFDGNLTLERSLIAPLKSLASNLAKADSSSLLR